MSEKWNPYDVEWIMERVKEMSHDPDNIEFNSVTGEAKIVFDFSEDHD